MTVNFIGTENTNRAGVYTKTTFRQLIKLGSDLNATLRKDSDYRRELQSERNGVNNRLMVEKRYLVDPKQAWNVTPADRDKAQIKVDELTQELARLDGELAALEASITRKEDDWHQSARFVDRMIDALPEGRAIKQERLQDYGPRRDLTGNFIVAREFGRE
jgi:chromosome segregation ATPase